MSEKNLKKLAIQVEGWRGISHSYALVNQFQLLHWKKSNLVSIKHIDMPFVMAHWSSGENSAGFNEEDINAIENISEDIKPQVIYRIFAPFGLDTPVELPTLTFAVTEFGLNSTNYDQLMVDRYASNGGLIHTPSNWSKTRLMASGVPEKIIHVIPHAADSSYFFQMDGSTIAKNREILGYQPEDVILLNVGTHHWNKGLDVLIKAFAIARKNNKNIKLLLKDQRSTYLINSESYVQEILNEIGMYETETINSIRFLSGHLNLSQLNALYNVADTYVTPYRAEGFNLPAFEAKSCGTPVIATSGGATDDFLLDKSHKGIEGKLIVNSKLKEDLTINAYIEPSLEDLIAKLINQSKKENVSIKQNPTETWTNVCNKLMSILGE